MPEIITLLKRICIIVLLSVGTPANAQAQAVCPGAATDGNGDVTLQSLRSIYYWCGKLPPEPSQAEITALAAGKAKAKPDSDLAREAKFLDDTFSSNLRYQVWAGRDHDGDGVLDFRVSTSGEFRENDTDVDCDGTANVMDADPYGEPGNNSSDVCIQEPGRQNMSADTNQNGVPDHIDWRLKDVGAQTVRPADVQEGLLRDFGIALVDRRTKITPAMASELDQIIRHVYKSQITSSHPSLRVITADTDVCGGGNWAWASAHSSTLFIYPGTLELNPIMRMEILVHEIAHTLQFARDYTPAHLYWLRSWNGWQTEGFHGFAKTLGWTPTRDHSQKPYGYYQLVVPNCSSNDKGGNFYPFHWTFKGEASKTWQETWDFFKDATGMPVLSNPHLKSRHMIGRYAFNDAWEWHAEYTAAYAMNQILDAAKQFCTPSQAEALNTWLHNAITENNWNFNHENARGLDVYEIQIAAQFDVSDGTWVDLARYFVRASNPDVCGLAPLP